jgi:serine protease AprX
MNRSTRVLNRLRSRLLAAALAGVCLLSSFSVAPAHAGPYVTETSGVRWNEVGGIRWNEVGGVRWNEVGGIRWNEVGGVRWNEVGGLLFSDATGVRWNEVGGVRWNEVGALLFDRALSTGVAGIDLDLLSRLSFLPDTSSLNVIVTYRAAPTAFDLAHLQAMGIPGGTIFRRLPMVVVTATRDQIARIAALPAVRSVFADRTLSFFDEESRTLIGLDEVEDDSDLPRPGGSALSGAGVTIAVLDTGVDATHPDLPLGSTVVGNVRLVGAVGGGLGFTYPATLEGLVNTDLVLGHGTFVASVAAGTGQASGGAHRGTAPGASILALSAGDLFIVHVLEGFDYILTHQARYGVRVVNCSWGTQGFFDPDDPVNIATRLLYDAGITVVFAAGNQGPAPDTLNPYAVAPWVIGVGSSRKDGRLSHFSSRGIFEELLYHPTLIAPGEAITAATPLALNPVGGYYTTASGTSFAAPHVAGIVAVTLQARPGLTPAAIKRLLQTTATPVLERDRSEVGAGLLDAWASITEAVNPWRPFGTHVPGWLDLRPYRIEHRQAVVTEAVLPAGGRLALPVSAEAGALSWQATLAWGTLPGLNDLDLIVTDDAGGEVTRGDAFNGTSLFGRAEGAHILGAVPRSMTAEIFFKTGTGLADQKFHLRQETAVAVVTAYADVAALPAADRDVVTRAVARNVMIGRGDRFDAQASLSRGELARALALAAGRPQRIPLTPSFADIGPSHPLYPYVETVAGARARRVLIDPQGTSAFATSAYVTRLDFAVSLVRGAGLEAEAKARAGESLGLVDDDKIPPELRGYVAVALERRLIDTLPADDSEAFDILPDDRSAAFDPKGKVPRASAAGFLLRILELRAGVE